MHHVPLLEAEIIPLSSQLVLGWSLASLIRKYVPFPGVNFTSQYTKRNWKLEIDYWTSTFRFIGCKFHNWKSIEIQRKVHFPCATQVRHRCVALEKQLIVDAKIYEEPGGLLGHVSSCFGESPTVAKLEAVGNCPFTMNSSVVSDIVSWKHIAILRASQTRYTPLRITRTDIQIARPHAANLIKLIY